MTALILILSIVQILTVFYYWNTMVFDKTENENLRKIKVALYLFYANSYLLVAAVLFSYFSGNDLNVALAYVYISVVFVVIQIVSWIIAPIISKDPGEHKSLFVLSMFMGLVNTVAILTIAFGMIVTSVIHLLS